MGHLLLGGVARQVHEAGHDAGAGHGLRGGRVEGELPHAQAGLVEKLRAGRRLPRRRPGAGRPAQQRCEQGGARGAREERARGRLPQQPRQAAHRQRHAAPRVRRPPATTTEPCQLLLLLLLMMMDTGHLLSLVAVHAWARKFYEAFLEGMHVWA